MGCSKVHVGTLERKNRMVNLAFVLISAYYIMLIREKLLAEKKLKELERMNENERKNNDN